MCRSWVRHPYPPNSPGSHVLVADPLLEPRFPCHYYLEPCGTAFYWQFCKGPPHKMGVQCPPNRLPGGYSRLNAEPVPAGRAHGTEGRTGVAAAPPGDARIRPGFDQHSKGPRKSVKIRSGFCF